MKWFWVLYLVVVNVSQFVQMWADKRAAINGERRVPEKAFFLGALGGGTIGDILGMYVFHHKTLHAKFKYGMPAILILQIAIIIWINTL